MNAIGTTFINSLYYFGDHAFPIFCILTGICIYYAMKFYGARHEPG